MLPAVGARSPESRLISVLFPAPLGPIKACKTPRWTSSETLSTAASPPKTFLSPVAFKPRSIIRLLRQARPPKSIKKTGQATGKEDHHHHNQGSHSELPVLGQRAEQRLTGEGFLKEDVGERADDRAVQPSDPAEDEEDEDGCRVVPGKDLRIDESKLTSRKIAGQPCQRSGEDECPQLVEEGWKAQRAHPPFIDAQTCQGPAEGRNENAPEQEVDGQHDPEHEIVEVQWLLEIEELGSGELQLRLDVEVDAVRPSTELRIVEEVIEHLAEGQGDHDEVDA